MSREVISNLWSRSTPIEPLLEECRREVYREIISRLSRGGVMDQNYAKVILSWMEPEEGK